MNVNYGISKKRHQLDCNYVESDKTIKIPNNIKITNFDLDKNKKTLKTKYNTSTFSQNIIKYTPNCDTEIVKLSRDDKRLNTEYFNRLFEIRDSNNFTKRDINNNNDIYDDSAFFSAQSNIKIKDLRVYGSSSFKGFIANKNQQISNFNLESGVFENSVSQISNFWLEYGNPLSNPAFSITIDPNLTINSKYKQIQLNSELCLLDYEPIPELANKIIDIRNSLATLSKLGDNLRIINNGKVFILNSTGLYYNISKFNYITRKFEIIPAKIFFENSTGLLGSLTLQFPLSANNDSMILRCEDNTITLSNDYVTIASEIAVVNSLNRILSSANSFNLKSNNKKLVISKNSSPFLTYFKGQSQYSVAFQDSTLRFNSIKLLSPSSFNINNLKTSNNENDVILSGIGWGKININKITGFNNNNLQFLAGDKLFKSLDPGYISDFSTYLSSLALINLKIPTTDLNLNNYKITNLQTPTDIKDAINKTYVDTAINNLEQNYQIVNNKYTSIQQELNSFSFNIDSINDKISNNYKLYINAFEKSTGKYIYQNNSSVSYKYIEELDIYPIFLQTLSGNDVTLSLNNYKIMNISDPISSNDLSSKIYIDSLSTLISNNLNDIFINNNQINITALNISNKFINGKLVITNLDSSLQGLLYSNSSLVSNITYIPSNEIVVSFSALNNNLNINNNKIINVANPTSNNDIVNLSFLNQTNSTQQTIITNLANDTQTLTNKFSNNKLLLSFIDLGNNSGFFKSNDITNSLSKLSELINSFNLNFNNNRIQSSASVSNNNDAVTLSYSTQLESQVQNKINTLNSYFSNSKLNLTNLTSGVGFLSYNLNYQTITFLDVKTALDLCTNNIILGSTTNKIINVLSPTNNNELANKSYVLDKITLLDNNISLSNLDIQSIKSLFTVNKLNINNITSGSLLDLFVLSTNSDLVSWKILIPRALNINNYLVSNNLLEYDWSSNLISLTQFNSNEVSSFVYTNSGGQSIWNATLNISSINGILPITKLYFDIGTQFNTNSFYYNSGANLTTKQITLSDLPIPVSNKVLTYNGTDISWNVIDLNGNITSNSLSVSLLSNYNIKILDNNESGYYLLTSEGWQRHIPSLSSQFLYSSAPNIYEWNRNLILDSLSALRGDIAITRINNTPSLGIVNGEVLQYFAHKIPFSSFQNTYIRITLNKSVNFYATADTDLVRFCKYENDTLTVLSYIDSTSPTSLNILSDERYKHNFELLNSEYHNYYLDKVLDIPVYSYCFNNSDVHRNNIVSVGIKAQDSLNIFGSLSVQQNNNKLFINFNTIIYYLIVALKDLNKNKYSSELNLQNNELHIKLDELKIKLNKLKQKKIELLNKIQNIIHILGK